MFDETLKIVSDFDFFMKSVGVGKASYRYINKDLTIFDSEGISNKSGDLVISERDNVINRYLPQMMKTDYAVFAKYHYLNTITRYRLFAWLLKLIGRTARIFDTISIKK
jgi:hypothetical protein